MNASLLGSRDVDGHSKQLQCGRPDFIAYVRLLMPTSFMQQFRPLTFVEMMSCAGQDMKMMIEETLRWMPVRNVL